MERVVVEARRRGLDVVVKALADALGINPRGVAEARLELAEKIL